jgi:HNH endonuclease
MEQNLGRYLKPEEVVRHKDGNTLNNRIENLELVDSVAHHHSIHHPLIDMSDRTCCLCGSKQTSPRHDRKRERPKWLNGPYEGQFMCRPCYMHEWYAKKKRTKQKTMTNYL